MNQLFDENIRLDEELHKYYLLDDPEFEFISATTFVKSFFEKFDQELVAARLVKNVPKYRGMEPQQLIEEWSRIAQEGTDTHKEIEMFIKNSVSPAMPKSIVACNWIESLDRNKFDLYSEVIIYSKELGIAGTIDLMIVNKTTGQLGLYDWKTNRNIDSRSFDNRMGNTPVTRHLMDCHLIHYSLQLSLYAYILEKEYDINPKQLVLIHLTGNERKPIECSYLKNDIEKMLKFRITQREVVGL